MSRHGYRVSAGYRGALYLPGGQQLAPDARLTAHFCPGEFPTEYMRGSNWIPWGGPNGAERQKIRRQLEQYVPTARRLGSLSVACLCQNEAVIEVAKEEAANIARDYDVALHALAMLEGIVAVGDAAPDRHDFIRPIYMLTHWYVEYERSAATPAAIRNKLMPYFHVARSGYNCPVIVICETPKAADIFRQQHRNLQRELDVEFPLITSTYAQVAAGDQFDTCWNLDGHPAALRSIPVGGRIAR